MDIMNIIQAFMMQYKEEIMIFSYAILGLGLLQNIIYFIQLPLATLELLKMKLKPSVDYDRWLLESDITIPLTIIIPAYNEGVTISQTVMAALSTQYPSFEVIVVNDGSQDDTLQQLITDYKLSESKRFFEKQLEHQPIRAIYSSKVYKNLTVVDKANGGRADAINLGINLSRSPIFCTLDADSMLDPTALLKTLQPFIEDPDRVVATGGTVRILNGCIVENGVAKKILLPSKLLPLFQVIEYIRAFLMGRLAWSRLGIVTIISGAFSIFRRDIAISAGGFSTKTIGEDFELVMKVHHYCMTNKRDYKMQFIPEPVCWTEAPETLEVLRSQRIRWQQGALEVFFKHKKMFMNPKFGKIGMVAYPAMFIFDVIGPIAELSGYLLFPLFYAFDLINAPFMLAFICLFFAFGVFISVSSLVLEELSLKRLNSVNELMKLGLVAIIENFGYRQYNNVWRLIGWWRFLRKKQSWGNMVRVGTKSE